MIAEVPPAFTPEAGAKVVASRKPSAAPAQIKEVTCDKFPSELNNPTVSV